MIADGYIWSFPLHVDAGSHDLVDEEELLGQNGGDVQELLLHTEVIQDAERFGLHDFHLVGVESHIDLVVLLVVQQHDDGFLHVISAVLSQDLRDHEQSIGESLDAQLDLAFDGVLEGDEVVVAGDFEGSGSGEVGSVVNDVLDSSESIPDGVLDLGDGVVVLALDQNGAGERVLAAFHEGVLLVSDVALVHFLSVAQVLLGQVVH